MQSSARAAFEVNFTYTSTAVNRMSLTYLEILG